MQLKESLCDTENAKQYVQGVCVCGEWYELGLGPRA